MAAGERPAFSRIEIPVAGRQERLDGAPDSRRKPPEGGGEYASSTVELAWLLHVIMLSPPRNHDLLPEAAHGARYKAGPLVPDLGYKASTRRKFRDQDVIYPDSPSGSSGNDDSGHHTTTHEFLYGSGEGGRDPVWAGRVALDAQENKCCRSPGLGSTVFAIASECSRRPGPRTSSVQEDPRAAVGSVVQGRGCVDRKRRGVCDAREPTLEPSRGTPACGILLRWGIRYPRRHRLSAALNLCEQRRAHGQRSARRAFKAAWRASVRR